MRPNLAVIDLDRIPAPMALDLKTLYFDGVLSSEVLSHLAGCAREREARDEEKLAQFLFGDAVST